MSHPHYDGIADRTIVRDPFVRDWRMTVWQPGEGMEVVFLSASNAAAKPPVSRAQPRIRIGRAACDWYSLNF